MKLTLVFALAAAAAMAQDAPDGGRMSFVRMSPILNAVDVNQDGVLSAGEINNAPAQLRKLDKNGDGKLTRDEAGLQMQMGRGPERTRRAVDAARVKVEAMNRRRQRLPPRN